jgi:hypothetical protein
MADAVLDGSKDINHRALGGHLERVRMGAPPPRRNRPIRIPRITITQ